jgi:hypothetical protein
MVNTYDREMTPGGVHAQPKIKGWASWELTKVNDRGEVTCAAASFDPPWKATEDKEGATLERNPPVLHSAVGHLTPAQMRTERAQRRLAIASGAVPQPLLALNVAEAGPAAQRREFFRMNFRNEPLGQRAWLHSEVGDATPAQLRASRVGRADCVDGALEPTRGEGGRRQLDLAASARVNFFRFDDKPGATFSPHPGPISNAVILANLTPAQIKRQRSLPITSRQPRVAIRHPRNRRWK